MSSLAFWGRHVFPVFLEMLGKTCLPYLPRDVGEVMSSLSLPEMLGKTCLPCLPQDVRKDMSSLSSPSSQTFWGRHVFPRDVGEDMSSLSSPRYWGRHLGMLGKTLGDVGEDKNIGEDTQGCRGGHQGGRGGHLGTTGKASICCLRYLLQWGTSGKTLGDDGDIREGFNLLPEVSAAMGDDGDESWG